MSNRQSVLGHIIEHGPSKRDEVIQIILGDENADTNPLRQAFYQLVKGGWLEQSGATTDPNTIYTITPSGREYHEENKGKTRRKPYKKRPASHAVQAIEPAPIQTNISVTAQGLTDQVSAVLAENHELRTALVEMRSTINRLLGDEHHNIIHFGGSNDGGSREHSHSD